MFSLKGMFEIIFVLGGLCVVAAFVLGYAIKTCA